MKNFKLIIFLLISFFPNWLIAKQVNLETARQIAQTQISSWSQFRNNQELSLIFTKTTDSKTVNAPTKVSEIASSVAKSSAPADVLYYVFNVGEKGFVIVAGDDIAKPVLGYSDTGTYDPNNLSPGFVYFLDDCLAKEIEQAITQGITQDEKTKEQWDNYLTGNTATFRATTAVPPILTTTWNQTYPYNYLCPNQVYTGCVATAMAQIMKRYNYPAARTVTIPAYNTRTNNWYVPAIAGTTYEWSYMPNKFGPSSTSDSITAVAILMYHVGAAVQMDYTASASAAYAKDMGKALVSYFDYDQGIRYEQRKSYYTGDWETLLRTEIDAGRPIFYLGQGYYPGEGHAFVCDGYDDSGQFHFNWGWGGKSDNYFVTTSLNPNRVEGAAPDDYNAYQEILINIRPNCGGSGIIINANISTPTTVLDRGESFTVNAPVRNSGLFNFTGVVSVAIVDANNNILSVIGQESSISLDPGNSTTNNQFPIYCTIPVSTSPGNYQIRVVSKLSEASQWTVALETPGYVEVLNLIITNNPPREIVVNDDINGGLKSSATTVDQREIFTVSVTFRNSGTDPMTSGDYGVALVDGNDQILEVIGTYHTSKTLSAGSVFPAPFNISCAVSSAITSGNYKIRAVFKPADQDWSIAYRTSNDIIDILDLTVNNETFVAPMTWLGNTPDWNVSTNWSVGRIPTPSDTVIIAANASNFPDLTAPVTVAAICFEPGAQIGHQSKLTGKAFVQYDFSARDKWLMLSMPLSEAYPDDFTFGNYPKTWVQTLTTTTNGSVTKGDWVTLHEADSPDDPYKFSYGDGFVIWLNDDDYPGEPENPGLGLKLLTGNIRELPFFQHHAAESPDRDFYGKVHQAHDYDSNAEQSTFYNVVFNNETDKYERNTSDFYTVNRTPDAYQLAGASFPKILNFTNDNFALTGNPYMAILDFDKLYQNNSDVINGNYYVWSDAGYKIYSSSLGVYSGVIGTDLLNNYIAPLQGFIVGKSATASDPAGSLTYNENMTTLKQDIQSSSPANNKNELMIDALTPSATVRTIIAKRDNGQDEFGNMDARTIINSISNVPEIYTLKPYNGSLIATGINIINNDDLLIPVGLVTSYAGNITISFSGMDRYDANISFIDSETSKIIDLTGLASFDYMVNYTPKQVNGAAAPCEDRFFICISKIMTGLTKTLAEKVKIYELSGQFQVISGASNPIKEIVIYNLQGALIYKESSINAISHTINRHLPSGAYIVKVISEKNTDNIKLLIEK